MTKTVKQIKRVKQNTKETPASKKLKVAAYCRVSTDTDEQEVSFNTQVIAYQDKILNNPEWTYAGIYTDEGISGTAMEKRPGFMKMMADAEAGKIDRILTKSISRFARNTVDCVNCVKRLKELGITVLFEKENIDTASNSSEMMLTVLAAFAQEESRNISSNMRWNIMKRYEEGKDRWCPIYGYKRDESGKTYVIVNEEAEIIQQIFDLYETGMSIMNICNILEEKKIPAPNGKSKWDPNRIRQILKNEKYCGDIILQKYYVQDYLTHKAVENDGALPQFLVKNHHDAIVTPEQFYRCEAIRLMKSATKTGHNDYPFGEKIICPYCKKPLIQQKVITRHQSRGWRCETDPFLIESKYVELAVIKAYKDMDLQKVAAIASVSESDTDIKKASAKDFLLYRTNTNNFKSVEYHWVDRIIDQITFEKQEDNSFSELTVHWKFGLKSNVQTGIDPQRENPEVLWNIDHNSKYRQKSEARDRNKETK